MHLVEEPSKLLSSGWHKREKCLPFLAILFYSAIFLVLVQYLHLDMVSATVQKQWTILITDTLEIV